MYTPPVSESKFPSTIPRVNPPLFTLSDLPFVRASGVRAGIKASGNPDLGLLVFDHPVSTAGIFTQNKFAAAPVIVCREHLEKNKGKVRALVVNSGNANACTGEEGLKNAYRMCKLVAARLSCDPSEVLVSSTGIIGRPLPMDKIEEGIAKAFFELARGPLAGDAFLNAIMTTDAFPKQMATELPSGLKVAGVCKGAGMIHPNMATMLAYLATNESLSPSQLKDMILRIASRSFNAVHVDTHPSTNDTFLLFATGKEAAPKTSLAQLEQTLTETAHKLARLIARDGEGASKVVSIFIRGALNAAIAKKIADHIAASTLVRTALYGNDPNWGRFVSQVGNVAEVIHPEKVVCTLQGIKLFEKGEPLPFEAAALSKKMAVEDVSLEIDLGDGDGEAFLMTSDLGYRYVEVNAEYTT